MSDTTTAPAVAPANTTDTTPAATTSSSAPATDDTAATGTTILNGIISTAVDAIPVAVRKRLYEIGSLAIAVAGVIASSSVLPSGGAHIVTEAVTVVGAGLPLLARSFTK